MIFNPVDFGFRRHYYPSMHGQTFQNEIADIRRVEGWVRVGKDLKYALIDEDISPNDIWKIKYKNENKYIYVGKIPSKSFALELLSNLKSISEETILKIKRENIKKIMNQFNYNPAITQRVLKTEKEQYDKFFYQGHPNFLIPDFFKTPEDIWITYLEYLEKNYSCDQIWDQEGGEVHSIEILDENTGLTKCIYTAYDLVFNENDESQDIDVEIEGYVVEYSPNYYVFIATKVFEQSKMSI